MTLSARLVWWTGHREAWMAERFVFGFVASSNALPDLVGSRLDAGELLAGVSAVTSTRSTPTRTPAWSNRS